MPNRVTRGQGLVGALSVNGTTLSASATELNFLSGVSAGTAAASKAAVLGSNKNLDTIVIADGGLKLGSGAGTSVSSTATELNKLASVTAGTTSASKALVVGTNKELDTLVVADGGLKLGSGAGTAVTATATEINTVADLSVNLGLPKVKVIQITTTPTGSEQDTGWDLPAKALVLDVFVDVTTAEATGTTKTLDIGLLSGESGGDADGFANDLSVASTGLKRPNVTTVTGGTETYVSAWDRGALLLSGTPKAGANVLLTYGIYHEKPHSAAAVTAKSVSYTAGSGDWAEFRGSIVVVYVELA